MSRLISASLRKSFADVTRRKGRALLVALGIFIGVFSLTAINTAEDALFAALTFSLSGQTTQPDILLDVDHLDPALLPTLQSTTDVQTVQYQGSPATSVKQSEDESSVRNHRWGSGFPSARASGRRGWRMLKVCGEGQRNGPSTRYSTASGGSRWILTFTSGWWMTASTSRTPRSSIASA